MGFARKLTAGTIVQEVCGVQGLPVPVAVAANTADTTAQQMWNLLRTVGRRLCKPTATHRWQALKRNWQFATDPVATLYALPADFDSFIDTTAWNLSSRLPLLGPATDMQWSVLKARLLGGRTISIIYRQRADKLELQVAPSTVQTLSIDYSSRAWVQLVSSPNPANPTYADAPTEDGDIVMFDPELVVAGLQRAFMTAKGFDTTAISTEYESLLEAAICADEDAPVLSFNEPQGFPLINPIFNVPDTGYGT